MSPAELWELAASGDRTAFAQVYRLYANRVFAHLQTRAATDADVEDMTAAVFEAAWKYRATITAHPTGGVLPWLLTAASNQARGYHRSQARRRRLLARGTIPEFEPDLSERISDINEQDWQIRLLYKALDRLRSDDWQIIELRLIDCLPTNSVAAMLHLPLSTVRSRLARALARARRLYLALEAEALGNRAVRES